MGSQVYWTERLTKNQFKKHTKRMEKELLKAYKETCKELQASINDIWLKALENGGEMSAASIYEYGRYRGLQAEINKSLTSIGEKEIDVLNSHLEAMYEDTYKKAEGKLTGVSFSMFNPNTLNEVINANFKGATFSARIWLRQDKLKAQLNNLIIQSAVLGKDHRKVAKEVEKRFSVSYSDAKRLVRTETMRVLNSACINSAKDRGYKRVMWLTAEDEMVCKECGPLNRQVMEIDRVEAIPLHPNCKCTVLPVVE